MKKTLYIAKTGGNGSDEFDLAFTYDDFDKAYDVAEHEWLHQGCVAWVEGYEIDVDESDKRDPKEFYYGLCNEDYEEFERLFNSADIYEVVDYNPIVKAAEKWCDDWNHSHDGDDAHVSGKPRKKGNAVKIGIVRWGEDGEHWEDITFRWENGKLIEEEEE